jgi:hypothetical protein
MEKDIQDSIKQIMSTQLTETECMIYLLIKQGKTFRDVVELPFGFTHETARTMYERAEKKMDKLAELGLFTTKVQ